MNKKQSISAAHDDVFVCAALSVLGFWIGLHGHYIAGPIMCLVFGFFLSARIYHLMHPAVFDDDRLDAERLANRAVVMPSALEGVSSPLTDVAVAVEFGYKGCERGWNLQRTQAEARAVQS